MLIILDSQQYTLGVASNGSPDAMPYFNDTHVENLEGVNTYEFDVPAQHEDATLLAVEGHFIIRNLDGENLLFTIKEVKDGHDNGKKIKHVYGEETAISELLGEVQRPITLVSTTLSNAANIVIANAPGWTMGDIPLTDSQDVEIKDYTTVLEALRDLMSTFSTELYFTVDLRGTQIVGKKVNIVTERGTKSNVRFDFGYDVAGVSRTENSENVVTALIGVGKGDSNKERLNLSSLPAFEDGDFYKEAGGDWIGSKSALQRWGKNGRHRFGVFIDSDADTAAALQRSTLKELEDRITPALSYSASIVTLERLAGYSAKKLRLGDYVIIKDKTFNPPIIVEGRVKETQRSYTTLNEDKVNLGKYKPITVSPDPSIRNLQNLISQSEEKWNTLDPEVQQQISEIDNRTSDVQMIQTVVYSGDMDSILSDKVNREDISDMATGEMLSGVKDDTIRYIDGRIDGEGGINESINKVTSEFSKSINDIQAKFTSSGGVNIIKNSIGYAGTDFWTPTGNVTTLQNQELEQLGFGSGFMATKGVVSFLEQTVSVTPNQKYSLSFWLKKTLDNSTSGWVGVNVYANDTKLAFIGKNSGEGLTKGWELGIFTFETQYSEVTIKLTYGSNAEGIISGLMLNVGEDALQWQHADGELYNTNIQLNLNGIKVINGQSKGYTIMSPSEFSGYSEVLDDNNQPHMERIFTLNGETTEVSRLDADKSINMASMRIVPIDATGSKGWAFVANE
jgi:phage minor structural protein